MGKLKCLLIIVLNIALPCYAQDESSILSIISSGDLKKLEKADDYKKEGDKLVEESNSLNMEVFTVQADESLNEKSRTKKAAQLEEQAQQKQIEASGLYEKSNEIRFSLYKQYIDAFWKTHEGQESQFLNAKLLEEQASDNYFQAASYRVEARKIDGYARVEKLNEATNLELQAIQKQVSALGAYHGITMETSSVEPLSVATPETNVNYPAVEPTNTSDTPAQLPGIEPVTVPVSGSQPETTLTTGQISVNQSMIDAYNRYVATGEFTDTSLATGKIAGVTAFESDRLLQLWYEYIYGRGSIPEDLVAETAEDPSTTEQPANPVSSESVKGNEIGIVTDENKSTLIPADENVIYRVQIAANRNELSQRALSKMYYGNKNVEMINEDGWYKYSVGDFASYDEAAGFRKQSGMSNAFVVAYRKGTQFNQSTGSEAVEEISGKAYSPQGVNKLPPGIVFRIQVAACRVPLTVSQLRTIYSGNYPLEMISEDGWYKYQFMGVRLYSDALQIIKNITTNGVFIVAYEDGVKINLAEAVSKTRELEKTVRQSGRKGVIDEIEFHMQIAASKVPMPEEELKTLYAGTEAVSIIYEDGWYKYHLKAGNSAQEAEQFRMTCGVPKAFIVTYKRAAKIALFQAIQELKQNTN